MTPFCILLLLRKHRISDEDEEVEAAGEEVEERVCVMLIDLEKVGREEEVFEEGFVES